MTKRLVALLIAVIMMTTVAVATDSNLPTGVDSLLSGDGIDEVTDTVPPQVDEFLADSGDIRGSVEAAQPQNLIKQITLTAKRYLTAPLRMLVSLCGIMILCAMLEIFHTTLNAAASRNIMQIVIAIAVSSVIVAPVVECITEAAVILRDFSYFIVTYIPVFAGVLTAAGQPLTAAAYNIFMFWICQTTAQLISSYFVPMLCAYLALSIISVVCPNLQLGKLVGGIKTFVTWGLTLTLTVFVGLMSVQSVVAYSGDNVTVKTAKFMIGSLIPGVGGALSDLFVAAQGCIQLAKGTLGAFGVVVTLLTFLPIVIKVLLWYLSLNVASLIGNILGVGDIAGLLRNISSTLGLLLAVLFYDALLVIISTTIIIVTFNAH